MFLSSCTIDANLSKENKNKIEKLLNSATDNQATTIKTNSNAEQNKTDTAEVAELQNQLQSTKDHELQILHFKATPPTDLPKENIKNAKTKAKVTPAKQTAPTQVKTGPKGTKIPNKKIKKPQKHTTYSLDESNIHTNLNLMDLQSNNSSMLLKQAQSSFVQASSIKSQTSRNNLLRKISEEKNKIKNNNGFRETYDQFKMKDSAFALLDVISNISVFDRSYAPQLSSNTPEAENERNKFYAIMNFDQLKTTQFGSIMETLYKEDQNHSLIRSLIISGLGIQISFELALEELEKKIEILNQEFLNDKISSFNFDIKIKELESKLNTILTGKKEWSKQVEALISNASSNSSLKDSKSLAQYIKTKYLDKMQNARQSVLDLYISITEFK
ncbi:complement regulator-acquiring protein [Borreliella japonica]|uniref:complement regulator-acquiring protein n=2 Tax=Borreliella japonica TaxID=34095 RepID=UPI00264A3B5A|nr:complement regulator-acquiring protein [Borreliella japonica]WKC87697.1 complement regulator-acquiring protein [Borreliella japonica]